MKAATILFGLVLFSLPLTIHSEAAEPSKAGPPTAAPTPVVYTPDNVMIDRFQARNAALSDVLEALGVLCYNATAHHYRPTFVVIGGVASSKPVSLNLSRSSLSNAIALVAEDSGLRVTHRQGSVIFSARQ